MNFGEAIRTCFAKYATFSGRARRPEYWYFVLFLVLGGAVASALDALVFSALAARPLTTVFQLAVLLPLLAAGWRRMHDTGRPGWFYLLPLIVSLAFIFTATLGFFGGPNPTPNAEVTNIRFIALGVVQFIAALLLLWWLVQPTQAGDNAYGPEPAKSP